ncbi:MAG TPA: 4'-phosphopantetheinyl transferase superfamily protein [Leptolyngbyaceae cyanobacterium]
MPSCLQSLAETLSPDEKNRAERFHFERDRKRFTAARGILRNILSRYLNTEPQQVEFTYSSRGKPSLARTYNDRNLQFNVSHSQDLAVYGITLDRAIGIDIEYIRSTPDAEQIVNRFFSENEKSAFSKLPPHQKEIAFFHAWTQKEAFLKATGDGLAGHLDQIEVSPIPDEPARLLSIPGDRQPSRSWLLHDFKPSPDFVAAVAIKGIDFAIAYWEWKF